MRNIIKVLIGAVLCMLGATHAFADTSFYEGKTLTIIVPYSTGGGHDTIARLLSSYMQKYLGVSQVKVENKPGGGGLVGDNAVYNSSPDGLTIGVIDTGGVFAQILNQPGVDFDMSKYTILGSPDFSPHVFLGHPDGKYSTFADVLNSKSPVTVLATGKGGASYELTTLILDAFNVPHKMVAAFKGEHNVVSTFLAGQGDLVVPAIHYLGELGDKVHPLMLVSNTKYSKLPTIPAMAAEAKKANISQTNAKLLQTLSNTMFTDVLVVAPPGVPAAREKALNDALQKAVADPAYRKAARKQHDVPQYTSGAEMKQSLETLISDSGTIRNLVQ